MSKGFPVLSSSPTFLYFVLERHLKCRISQSAKLWGNLVLIYLAVAMMCSGKSMLTRLLSFGRILFLIQLAITLTLCKLFYGSVQSTDQFYYAWPLQKNCKLLLLADGWEIHLKLYSFPLVASKYLFFYLIKLCCALSHAFLSWRTFPRGELQNNASHEWERKAFAVLNDDRSLDFPSAAKSSILLCLLTTRFYWFYNYFV